MVDGAACLENNNKAQNFKSCVMENRHPIA